ncbi:MAG: hypothetical protein IBJ11_12430, partial [Phycisphaerales bacterium]|nr:hypothetical protein [Phycisphaerales bacterium]
MPANEGATPRVSLNDWPLGALVCSSDWRVRAANRLAGERLGLRADQLPGSPLSDLFEGFDAAAPELGKALGEAGPSAVAVRRGVRVARGERRGCGGGARRRRAGGRGGLGAGRRGEGGRVRVGRGGAGRGDAATAAGSRSAVRAPDGS